MRRILTCLAIVLVPFLAAAPVQAGLPTIQPTLETPVLFDDDEGGNADVDDPAIWVHPTDRSRSRVLVTAKNGGLYVYDLRGALTLPSSFALRNGSTWTPCLEPGEGPQAEGLVVDPVLGVLYVAQEDVALWRIQLAGGPSTPRIVERVKEFGVPATFDEASEECIYDWSADPGEGGRIAADVEGLTIYRTGLVTGTLLVSSQGDDTYYTYDRLTNRALGHLAIAGVQECDGAATVSIPLPGFPNGLLVVHDGQALPGSERAATNVKYVDAGFFKRHR